MPSKILSVNYFTFFISLVVTCLYSTHIFYCLPFSGYTREFNYETIATLASFFIYTQEPWSFPLGQIKSLTFPFEDANVGNVGALPLFAISFKILGTFIDYFKTFDYFVLIELTSCFGSAFFSQKILLKLGVRNLGLIALAGLLCGSSLLLINRSMALQPFCVISAPIFLAWMYVIILFYEDKKSFIRLVACSIIFPVAILLDGYTFFGIILGTGILLIREFYEAYFGGVKNSWIRLINLALLCIFGTTLSYFALYIIGMYPMPQFAQTFTSYDFGMGGRYHVADLFTTFLPQSNQTFKGMLPSLLSFGGFLPLTTDILSGGQYEGIAYFGTPVLIISILYLICWVVRLVSERRLDFKLPYKLTLLSPWAKIAIGVTGVFVFSLGYELHILGRPFPNFNLMPAAWIADRIPSLYNVRAPGRLASLLSFFLILELFRRISIWLDSPSTASSSSSINFKPTNKQISIAIFFLALLHLVEIAPFLTPIKAQPLFPLGRVFNQKEIAEIERLSAGHNLVLLAPSVRAVDVQWETEAFSFAYTSKLRSNLYYLARTDPKHDQRVARDLQLIESGNWKNTNKEC